MSFRNTKDLEPRDDLIGPRSEVVMSATVSQCPGEPGRGGKTGLSVRLSGRAAGHDFQLFAFQEFRD